MQARGSGGVPSPGASFPAAGSRTGPCPARQPPPTALPAARRRPGRRPAPHPVAPDAAAARLTPAPYLPIHMRRRRRDERRSATRSADDTGEDERQAMLITQLGVKAKRKGLRSPPEGRPAS